ncbi:RNA polymerase II subunit A C-terminal domain phosphatase [Toxorhynchites rutilus septentrionalis]|uniref:RNA polymerase II subunit A C-terminal domain phosphatase n=1 Tax=Toxorhynchites rutilus septentrionalis TaxID=329112 RepID=UPI00247B1B97|nr:RNA polymerase II subunit A C-terminal domain phosphatase [Toxorhynchites rutilus septentrionalis]
MAEENQNIIHAPTEYAIKINKWKVREGYPVTNGNIILFYECSDGSEKDVKRLKATKAGVVKKRLAREGDVVDKGKPLLQLEQCSHTTVIKDMCADCGADLRQDDQGGGSTASVPMIHSVPELKVTETLAKKLGQADTERLLQDKKLVLLVDLDQTLIHTTNDNVPNNLKDVYHFQLYGPNSPWYHTRLRPGALQFLVKMDPYYELHICTFGARNYAHMIAQFLDEDGKLFSHRILSRDECFNATSKTDNLRALFPCGDSMVCIIDDREDVWNMAANLIQVKPYHFFQHTGDINAPPGMSKNELDGKGVDFKDLMSQVAKDKKDKAKESSRPPTPTIETDDGVTTEEDPPLTESSTTSKETIKEHPSNEEQKEKPPETPSESDEKSEKGKVNDSKDVKSKKDPDEKHTAESLSDDNLIHIEDPDDYLLYLEHILLKIHQTFYQEYEKTQKISDLKTLIPWVKSQVLIGFKLVFSGLVPNTLKLEESKAYQIARGLGASVTQNIEAATTHLVAVTFGTSKVNNARKNKKIHIVTPEWLWTCAERWEHVDERLYPLRSSKPSKMRQPPPHCHSPEHAVNYGDSRCPDGPSKSAAAEQESLKFIDTINPLLRFSNDDLDAMNDDFDEFFESDDTSSDDEPIDIENPPMNKSLRKRKRIEEKRNRHNIFKKPEGVDDESSMKALMRSDDENDNSQTNVSSDEDESPSAKFRRGGDLPSDLDMGSNSEGSNDPMDDVDDGDWNMMGAALEREFLGLDE